MVHAAEDHVHEVGEDRNRVGQRVPLHGPWERLQAEAGLRAAVDRQRRVEPLGRRVQRVEPRVAERHTVVGHSRQQPADHA